MNEAVLITAIAALPGLGAAYFAYRKSIKAGEVTSKNEALKVEAGAYERARKLYEDGIKQLEEQVKRLREQLGEEQTISEKLRKRIWDMEETIQDLRTQLSRAGIDLAPNTTGKEK